MSQYQDEQNERDQRFTEALCMLFDFVRMKFEEWVASEVRGQQAHLEDTAGFMKEIRSDLDELKGRLAVLNLLEIEEAKKRVKERMEEIKGSDLYDDPLESYNHVVDSFAALERIVRRLLVLRRQIDGTPPGDGTT